MPTPIEEAFAAGWVPQPRPKPLTPKQAMKAARARAHVVYFFQQGEDGPIKIGVAANPLTRHANIQACSPVQIHLLGLVPGSFALEKEIHRHLAGFRLRGEWFAPAPEVLAYVRKLLRTSAMEG